MSEIAVAVVNYNTRGALRQCLDSVRADGPSELAELVVVDNGSTDGSPEMVAEEFPGVELYVDRSNPGYGAAGNRALAETGAPIVLLLNSDTRLRPGALAALRTHLDEHSRTGLVGPRLLNPDGSLQPSCYPFPGPLSTLLAEGQAKYFIRFVPGLRRHYLRTWDHDRVRRIPWVLGAAIAIRRSSFEEVGGFAEEYFMYFEEVDLCYRLDQAGWQVHFTPAAEVVHTGGASTDRLRADMRVQYYRSLLQFYRRHRSSAEVLALQATIRGAAAANLLRDRVRLLATSDGDKASRLSADVDAWRRVMGGEWTAHTGRRRDST